MPDPVSWPLDMDNLAPSRARALLTTHCAELHPQARDDQVAVALLLVTELVTNAVRHGTGPVDLTVVDDDAHFRVDVCDAGAGPAPRGPAAAPVAPPEDPLADGGRGLLLVDQLSSSWGVSPGPGHTTAVWFELPPLA